MNEGASWAEVNQRCLVSALAKVRWALVQKCSLTSSTPTEPEPIDTLERKLEATTRALSAPAALSVLERVYALSPFERDVLLLAAGIELDGEFMDLCAAAQGDPRKPFPTFALALAALPDAHWSALSPSRPLRRHRLIELSPGESLTQSRLRIDEHVLHFLTGIATRDERLSHLEPVAPGELTPSQQALAQRMAEACALHENELAPTLQLLGPSEGDNRLILAGMCERLGLTLSILGATDLPASPVDRSELVRLLERDALFSGGIIAIECHDANAEELARARSLIERLSCLVLVNAREPLRLRKELSLIFEAPPLSSAERHYLWKQALGDLAPRLNGQLPQLAAHFELSAAAVRAVSQEVSAGILEGADEQAIERQLWASCRVQSRQGLEGLAQRIDSHVTWEDLVLSTELLDTLRLIAVQLRQRSRVYDDWGFGARGARGLGISALFSGPSGTGKTLASEVLANQLGLDLYRIDLSQVISKYIGETEKNLSRIFDAAERGGAILLFDEADALFGKRSDVKDSHDRYANVEVSYLLQRMEAYRGLAVLTTNLKEALDSAFLRRIRFVLKFPFPDAEQRRALWTRAFPPKTPTAALDFDKLAQLKLTGGNIRNIAIGAAFLAAEAERPVGMAHISAAAKTEFSKLEKSWSESEQRVFR